MKAIKQFIYNQAIKVIARKLVYSENRLTPKHLEDMGWMPYFDDVRQKTFYCESDIKSRDRILVDFENHYYRVWHGKDVTFIALETTKEWFDLYYMMAHPDNGRYNYTKI